MKKAIQANYQGTLICLLIAIASFALAQHYQAPVMLFALLFGLVFHFLYESPANQQGVEFCSRTILQIAVALLGVRIAFSDIVALGVMAPIVVISAMVIIFIVGILLSKVLGLSKYFGVLSSGSVAICGVSAAAAILTVLPKDKVDERDFALTVICITVFGTMAMIVYPIVAEFIGLNSNMTGVFLGGSIHDVAQVVGAGYSVSSEVGDVATYIKLMRVALLLPIVACIFLIFKTKTEKLEGGVSSFVPNFLIVFIALAVANNLGVIPEAIVELSKQLSSWLLVIAIAAIGVKTSLKQIVSVGWKPIFLVATESILFAGMIVLGIFLFL